MRTSDSSTKQIVGGFVVALLVGSVVSIAAVSAQAGLSSQCSGDFVSEGQARLFVGTTNDATFALDDVIPAGSYELTAISSDSYENRSLTPAQLEEQWFVEFLDATGSVLAVSAPTTDLEDGVEQATWEGSIGTVTLDADAVSVRAVHAAPDSTVANSVYPNCFGATALAGSDDSGGSDNAGDDGSGGGDDSDGPTTGSSSVAVDASPDTAPGLVGIVCDASDDSESVSFPIIIPGVEPGSECRVTYPQDLDCTLIADPTSSTSPDDGTGFVTVSFPTDEVIDVFIDIDCSGGTDGVDEGAGVTTTTIPITTASPTTTTVPPVSVAGISIVSDDLPTAPTAQAQPGTPTFTG